MRSCPSCGAQFSDDEVFCPVCGQEVQIVPDFVTAEIQLQELHKKIEEEERAQREARERAEMLRRRVRQRRNHVILVICLIAAAIAGWYIVTKAMTIRREHSTFSYQYEQAELLLKEGNTDEADEYIRRALAMQPENQNALLLQADILQAKGKEQDRENLLFHYIELYPNDEEGYVYLIEQYLKDERNEDVQAILASCTQPAVLQKYARLLPAGPVLSPSEGVFNNDQEITLETEVDGTIYYTIDGSDPTTSSLVYDSPFLLKEGITTVKAMLITDEGFPSPVAAGIYQIQYDAPPTPEITPESGKYVVTKKADANGDLSAAEREKERKITIKYPEGYICHYSFDQKPTESSPVYNRPIEMQIGEHIIYAVLESENGKLGAIASATYVYEVITLTPTPTPKPTTTYYNYQIYVTPTPTPAPEGGTPDSGDGSSSSSVVPGTDGENGTDTGDTPADGGTTPADGGTAPADGGTAPADGGTEPADGGTAPADGGTAPADGGTAPADGETAPADGGTVPADGGAAPADTGTVPADGGGAPAPASDVTVQSAPEAAPAPEPAAAPEPAVESAG